jgi:phosphoribosylamine-glycine ligase
MHGGGGKKLSVLLVGYVSESVAALHVQDCLVTCIVKLPDVEKMRHGALPDRAVLVADDTDVEQILAALRRGHLPLTMFDAVCSEDEFTLVAAALLGSLAGTETMPLGVAINLRDKFIQKNLVRAAALPVADCLVVDVVDDELIDSTVVKCPAVIKPLAGASTRDTHVLDVQHDLRRAMDGDYCGPWLIESFVAGAELQLDGVVRDGEIRLLAVSQYFQNLISIRKGGVVGAVTLDPRIHHGLYAQAQTLTANALHALGHKNGVFHMEAFQQEERLVFSECAGRIGGGMVREALAFKYSVDIADEWARAALGRASALRPRIEHRSCAEVRLTAGASGTLQARPSAQEIKSQPGVEALRLEASVGDRLADPSATSGARVARALVSGESEAAATAAALALHKWFQASCVITEANNAVLV